MPFICEAGQKLTYHNELFLQMAMDYIADRTTSLRGDAEDVEALINYYLRSGYPRHAQTCCNEMLKKRAGDPQMIFWRGVAMLKEVLIHGFKVPQNDLKKLKHADLQELVQEKLGPVLVAAPQQ